MKKRMRQKIPKLYSKKGMSLVELVVGITIIVIVFGATLSAMTNGFTNTLYNAEVNKNAAEGGSLNEIMMETAVRQEFYDAASVEALYLNGAPTADNAIHAAAQSVVPSIQYVSPIEFPKKGIENQYTIKTNASSTVTKGTTPATVKGMEIQTLVTNVKGTLVNKSFVAYSNQS